MSSATMEHRTKSVSIATSKEKDCEIERGCKKEGWGGGGGGESEKERERYREIEPHLSIHFFICIYIQSERETWRMSSATMEHRTKSVSIATSKNQRESVRSRE
jgi:hypothetical protein